MLAGSEWVYRGVGTSSDGPPGTMIVLVPLPLFNSMPGIADPGIMIVCGAPELPATRPAPREVVTLDVAASGGAGVTGVGTPPAEGGACAPAPLMTDSRTMAAIGQVLIIANTPGAEAPAM